MQQHVVKREVDMNKEKSEYMKQLEQLKSKECPCCSGHGYMTNLIDADAEEYKHVECPMCNGVGMDGV